MKKTDQDIIAEAIRSHLISEDEMWDETKHGAPFEKARREEFQAAQKASSEKITAQKSKLKIENPNSSGQGHSPLHVHHRFHDVLTQKGYVYSHTTPVIDSTETVAAHHTYRHPQGAMPIVSVVDHPHKGDAWSAHRKPGPSSKMGSTISGLDSYLTNSTKRAKRK
jgi:hypothetical protein